MQDGNIAIPSVPLLLARNGEGNTGGFLYPKLATHVTNALQTKATMTTLESSSSSISSLVAGSLASPATTSCPFEADADTGICGAGDTNYAQ
ncbi:hypothetical protein PM082_017272 [Marasmius tenuissimus]|nr:hypothetical protein PM082_017272 [Marasmius tenuissimus]